MSDALANYLYDHLCGATIAIEVMHALCESHEGTPLRTFVLTVLAEAEAERELLLVMSKRLGIAYHSVPEQSWVAENAALIKRGIVTQGQSGTIIALQYLAMIVGARANLWELLEIAAASDGPLIEYNFKQLAAKALMQNYAFMQQLIELTKAPVTDEYKVTRTLRRLLQVVRWLSVGLMRSRSDRALSSKAADHPKDSVRMVDFAILILVGPSEADLKGLYEIIESVLCYEVRMRWLVMIDDCEINRELTSRVATPTFCTKMSIHNPRKSIGNSRLGGQCSGIIAGLLWLFEHAVPDFVLKVDTDALVIAPFATKLASFINEKPASGVIGALGHTCNRSSGLFRCQLFRPSPLIAEYVARFGHLPGSARDDHHKDVTAPHYYGPNVIWPNSIWLALGLAYNNGYLGLHYCQGGSYAISAKMLMRLGESGLLCDGSDWASVPVGEDVMIGMYARAVGLDISDCSGEGQIFGVQFRALPYTPEELLLRGYSIVHSVRNNANFSEDYVRRFFRSTRGTLPSPQGVI